jgi:phospholipase A1
MEIKPAKIRNLCALVFSIACLLGMPLPAYAAKTKAAAPAKTKAAAPARKSSPSRSSGGHGLAQEWTPTNSLRSYKKNYFLFYSSTNVPNNSPTSANPQNQVLTPYALDIKDVKFQISVKHDLADLQQYGSLWFAYTQRSFWQFYDSNNSRPFRENDYEPEFIYSVPTADVGIVNFGIVHQSNGESNPRSRSWDRIYIQPGFEYSDGSMRIALLARWWQRLQEDPLSDNNPDIVNYQGYREFTLRYIEEGILEVEARSRIASIQVDVAAPWTALFGLDGKLEDEANIHLQYFNGYGESLLDYNQSHVSWGVGLSFHLE